MNAKGIRVKTQVFEDSTENDLKKNKNNLKSTKPQLKYFDPLNNTVRKTKSLKQKATSQNCKQYTTKRNETPTKPTVHPVRRLVAPLIGLLGFAHTQQDQPGASASKPGADPRVCTLDCEVGNQVPTLFLCNPSPTLKSFLHEPCGSKSFSRTPVVLLPRTLTVLF